MEVLTAAPRAGGRVPRDVPQEMLRQAGCWMGMWMGCYWGGGWGAIANPYPDVGHGPPLQLLASSLLPKQLMLPVGRCSHGSAASFLQPLGKQTLPALFASGCELFITEFKCSAQSQVFYFRSKTCKISLSPLRWGLRNCTASLQEPRAQRRGHLSVCTHKSPSLVPGRAFAASWLQRWGINPWYFPCISPAQCPREDLCHIPGFSGHPVHSQQEEEGEKNLGAPTSALGWDFRHPDPGCGAKTPRGGVGRGWDPGSGRQYPNTRRGEAREHMRSEV